MFATMLQTSLVTGGGGGGGGGSSSSSGNESDAERHREFRRRMRSVKVDLFCQFCQRRFSKSYNLMIHERSHLIDQNNYVCDICGKSFKKQDGLRQHRSQHSPSSSSSSSSSSGYSPSNSFY